MVELKYRIALINVFWTEEDINTRYFDSVESQNAYFDNLTGGNFSPLSNFNMGNNVETAVTYLDTSGRDAEELVHCNYAVVQKYNVTTGAVVSRRYFFAYPSQDSGRQMRVNLSLDDLQTNYISYKEQIAPCMIRRANLNRFVENEDGSISFNGSVDSPLFATEPLNNVSKRLTKRTNLNFHPDTNFDSEVNSWLDDNIVGWEYVYITEKDDYNMVYVGSNDQRQLPIKSNKIFPFDNIDIVFPVSSDAINDVNGIEGALCCLCYPIYKRYSSQGSNNVIKIDEGRTVISSIGMNLFREKNSNNSFVYARKFSLLPPFFTWSSYTSAFIELGNNLILTSGAGDKPQINQSPNLRLIPCGTTDDGDGTYTNHGVFQVTYQPQTDVRSETYVVDKALTFNKSDLIGVNKDPKFNPKLLNNQFYELNLTKGAQRFTYDYQKLNQRSFEIIYTEAMTPDITKGYARIADTSGVYIPECDENMTGLVYSDDNSLMVDNDQLSQMLANNKNYFVQQALQIGTDLVSGIGSSMVTGDPTKLATSLGNSVFDAVNIGLSLDNMRSAPNIVKNANGNAYFVSMISPYKIAIEEYDILDIEKVALNDIMTEYGFLYNHTGNLTDFDNIRKYYNYIEADVEVISAPISNVEKDRLRQRLKSVRFWNSDTIQYNLENYERWLET